MNSNGKELVYGIARAPNPDEKGWNIERASFIVERFLMQYEERERLSILGAFISRAAGFNGNNSNTVIPYEFMPEEEAGGGVKFS